MNITDFNDLTLAVNRVRNLDTAGQPLCPKSVVKYNFRNLS